jgi:hypothetical protein
MINVTAKSVSQMIHSRVRTRLPCESAASRTRVYGTVNQFHPRQIAWLENRMFMVRWSIRPKGSHLSARMHWCSTKMFLVRVVDNLGRTEMSLSIDFSFITDIPSCMRPGSRAYRQTCMASRTSARSQHIYGMMRGRILDRSNDTHMCFPAWPALPYNSQ